MAVICRLQRVLGGFADKTTPIFSIPHANKAVCLLISTQQKRPNKIEQIYEIQMAVICRLQRVLGGFADKTTPIFSIPHANKAVCLLISTQQKSPI